MRYVISTLSLLCFCLFFSYGSENTNIIVHNGENLIALTIRNETSVNIDNLKIAIDKSTAPEWIEISPVSVNLLITEKENDITLPLKIKNAPEGGQTSIDLIITAGNGAQWSAKLNLLFNSSIPKEYNLLPNFPNPFNPETTIKYTLAEQGYTLLKIYNVLGQSVCTIVNKTQSAGSYTVNWNGKDDNGKEVSSGTYFYKLESGSFSKVRRMMLVK